uniref:Uncharacterized protein n=1 Tax=Moniliophthora roreri TaxID=221103 RepID=A0A0W0EY49_MONRR
MSTSNHHLIQGMDEYPAKSSKEGHGKEGHGRRPSSSTQQPTNGDEQGHAQNVGRIISGEESADARCPMQPSDSDINGGQRIAVKPYAKSPSRGTPQQDTLMSVSVHAQDQAVGHVLQHTVSSPNHDTTPSNANQKRYRLAGKSSRSLSKAPSRKRSDLSHSGQPRQSNTSDFCYYVREEVAIVSAVSAGDVEDHDLMLEDVAHSLNTLTTPRSSHNRTDDQSIWDALGLQGEKPNAIKVTFHPSTRLTDLDRQEGQ